MQAVSNAVRALSDGLKVVNDELSAVRDKPVRNESDKIAQILEVNLTPLSQFLYTR